MEHSTQTTSTYADMVNMPANPNILVSFEKTDVKGKFILTKENEEDFREWQRNYNWYNKSFREWMKEKEEYLEECRRDNEEQYKQWLEDTQYLLVDKNCGRCR